MRRFLLIFLSLMWLTQVGMNAQQRVHVVLPHETLYRIALKYNVTVADLYKLNPGTQNGIRTGQEIRIPDSPTIDRDRSGSAPTYHAVESGETLYSISHKYGVSQEAILKANPTIRNNNIKVGSLLRIPVRQPASESTPTTVTPVQPVAGLVTYTIPAGETMYNLGRSTGWSDEELIRYNPQLKDGPKVGMVILIPDTKLDDNRALQSSTFPVIAGVPTQTIVLVLPFKDDNTRRFVDYYEGLLLALKELKDAGVSVNLHVMDCSEGLLRTTLSQILQMGAVDLIIGGVSDESIRSLNNVSNRVGARYVIPFTSKDYDLRTLVDRSDVFQINTPHEALFKVVAEKFVNTYRGYSVYLVNTPRDSGSKDSFMDILKGYMNRGGMQYSQLDISDRLDPAEVARISSASGKAVLVPSSASFAVAGSLMNSVSTAVDSLGVSNVSLFGYPEWQTYMPRLGRYPYKSQAAFYTTFYVDTSDPGYRAFQKEFISWYSHSVGNTFPRYSILGYDTARYFLTRRGSALVGSSNDAQQFRGIQSYFYFVPDATSPGVFLNNGVIFVNYTPDQRIIKR